MSTVYLQSTSGTSDLVGTKPDPTPGAGGTQNWEGSTGRFFRKSGGGVNIGVGAFASGELTIPVGTARIRETLTSVSVPDSSALYMFVNQAAVGDAPGSTGTGYALKIQGGAQLSLNKWSGAGFPAGVSSAGTLPAAPFTVTSAVFEHLTAGTINATVVVSGTTYTATLTDGTPLTGQRSGIYLAGGATAVLPASSIQIEDNVIVSPPTDPGAPTASSSTTTTGTIGWTASTGTGVTYTLQIEHTGVADWTTVDAGLGTNSDIAGTLAPNTSYRCRVKATTSGGDNASGYIVGTAWFTANAFGGGSEIEADVVVPPVVVPPAALPVTALEASMAPGPYHLWRGEGPDNPSVAKSAASWANYLANITPQPGLK